MQIIYLKDLGGATIDPLRPYSPLQRVQIVKRTFQNHTRFSQLARGMINSLPVDELFLSGIFSQVNPCSHQFLHWPVIGIDEKQF